jgi:hypothetical protein
MKMLGHIFGTSFALYICKFGWSRDMALVFNLILSITNNPTSTNLNLERPE